MARFPELPIAVEALYYDVRVDELTPLERSRSSSEFFYFAVFPGVGLGVL